ncbi:MAG: hypothetical protein E7643_05885 [Ruminococcaceae bacterium]|nr:hypothetical protein [Oscillospiraceae bacterium]
MKTNTSGEDMTSLPLDIKGSEDPRDTGTITPVTKDAPSGEDVDAKEEIAPVNDVRSSADNEPISGDKPETDSEAPQPLPRFPDWNRPAPLTEEELYEEPEEITKDTEEEIPLDSPPDTPDAESTPPRNIFHRLRRKKEQETEQRVGEIEWIRKKSGFSKEDIALIFELGYEDELARIVGYENLKKLKQDHKKHYGQPGYKHYRTAFGYSGQEEINEETLPIIIAKYLHDRKFLILRTVLTAIAAFVLLFFDYPALLGDAAGPIAKELPLLFPILSLVILLGVASLSYRQLNAGLRSFLKATPTPYSVPATTLLVVLLYDLGTLFLWGQVLHVNMLTCSLLLVLALCDVLRLVQEMRALHILGTNEEKTVLEPAHPRKKKLRRGNKMIKIINDDEGKSFYRIQRAEEITGFFRRFNTTQTAHLPFQYLICLSIGFSIIVAFIGAVNTPSLTYAFSSFVTALFISAPATAMFSFFYPLYRANKVLAGCKCVLLGNESVNEYATQKTIIFDDTDLYSAEKRAEVTVEDSDTLRADMKLAGALFRSLGGTLEGLGKTVGVVGEDPSISFERISDRGVEALADRRVRIVAGSADYLKKAGIRVPREDPDRVLRRTPNTGVIYIAIDGVLKFTYEIEYTEKLSFLALAKDLSTIDTSVAIESYDPSLNERFMQTSRPSERTPIRVIKPGRYEGDSLLKECDTGAVAVGDKHCIVYPLHAAHCVRECKRFGMHLQWFSFALGIILSAIFALFPEINILTPLSVTLYHGAFIGLSWLATHLSINRQTLRISHFF